MIFGDFCDTMIGRADKHCTKKFNSGRLLRAMTCHISSAQNIAAASARNASHVRAPQHIEYSIAVATLRHAILYMSWHHSTVNLLKYFQAVSSTRKNQNHTSPHDTLQPTKIIFQWHHGISTKMWTVVDCCII